MAHAVQHIALANFVPINYPLEGGRSRHAFVRRARKRRIASGRRTCRGSQHVAAVPPPGSECREDGPWVICQTGLIFEPKNEPIDEFGLPCGTIYETALDVRSGIRWYGDGKLIKRFATQQFDGTWSLSPVGAEPTVVVTSHDNWWTEYEVPGDESTGRITLHGNGFTVQAAGYGVIVHVAGHEAGDEFRGTFRATEDPEVATELCAALTR